MISFKTVVNVCISISNELYKQYHNTGIYMFRRLHIYTICTLYSTWTFQKQLYCSMSETKKSGNH